MKRKMDSKLSLMAAFDELMRNAKVLTAGIEPEFKMFVENQQSCRRQWATSEDELHRVRGKMITLESDNKALDAKLKHARNLIEKEEQKRLKVEHDKEQLERQIALIRELLMDSKHGSKLDQHDRERLAFLSTTAQRSTYEDSPPKRLSRINESNHSVLSDEDIDYWDKTEEDLEPPCGGRRQRSKRNKRPSAPPREDLNETPPKRHKTVTEESEVVTTTTITVTADGRPIEATTEVSVPSAGRKLNKSFSEPALDKHMVESETESDADPWTPRNMNTNASKSTLRGTPTTPMLRKAHSASKGLNRIHFFISETVIRPRTCVPCGKRIGFGRLAMKCKDCRSVCHPDCKDNLPLPCISAPPTPGTGKIQGGILSDYCRDECPMIPGIVIHCVNEIEARGLNEVGIYRVPGSDRQVKELKEKFFKGKGMPNLSNIDDIHVICGCLKDFLRGLKEPLVTFRLWRDFVKAAENRDKAMAESDMYQALSELPRANRDTIAFIMLHLLRVSQTPDCKMPANNLSRVFGPTIVGHSSPEPEPMQLINETKYQAMVMDRLFEIPEDYWINFISDEAENMYQDVNTPQTPEVTRGLLESRLGPVHTPGSGYERSRTWNARTPREEKRKLMPPLKELRRSMSESSV
ncbi:rac GTPase-activating protein 1-like isoform X2 [Mercenaria mercenaria]|uniref:rac GTPase-activating protein 1-like isoform X2 n=1 Tax=Mercenaria mercenaria TaxID=6596 RepID=UPI00234F851D|nr:rac GTPase-activating protein 1-like isoform X2 [Mercenaria mercenaria]